MDFSPIEISVVIPVRGSGSCLEPLFIRLKDALSGMGVPFEIVFVDDASPDGTWSILLDLRKRFPDIVALARLASNAGQHRAILSGFGLARGNYIVTMDDDGAHPPESIPILYAKALETGAGLVYGVPASRAGAGSLAARALLRLRFGASLRPSPFRLLKREIAGQRAGGGPVYIDVLLLAGKPRVAEVPVEMKEPALKSRYSPGKKMRLFLEMAAASFLPSGCGRALAQEPAEILPVRGPVP